MKARPKKRQYSKVKMKFPQKSIVFRGTQYWLYRDEFRGRKLNALVARLRRDGYKVRLTKATFDGTVLNIFTHPEVPRIPHRQLLYG